MKKIKTRLPFALALVVLMHFFIVNCSDDTGGTPPDSKATFDSISTSDISPTDASLSEDTAAEDTTSIPIDTGLDVVLDSMPLDQTSDIPVTHCSAAGGICATGMFSPCPPNTEPTYPDPYIDCSGLCCVPAPPSTCSAEPSTTCFYGTSCPNCWLPPPPSTTTPLTCESGRICCLYVCN